MWWKNILKKLLPIVFLKKAFLIYNVVKIKTIDKILFPEYEILNSKILFNINPKPFKEVDLSGLNDSIVSNYMKQWLDWEQEQYIVKIDKPSFIEPDYGWNLVDKKLNYYSLGFSRTFFQPKPKLSVLFKTTADITIDKAISLRDTGEENYFHFYNDVVAKIFFLKKHGINLKDYTFVISKKIWDKKYFQYFYKKIGVMQDLNFYVQNNELIRVNECVFCKPLTHQKELFDLFANLSQGGEDSRQRKVFLKRNKNRLRFIENDVEIESLMKEMGFEIVDTDHLAIEDQISLFSQVRWLVAIHGAGLTNMIYRKSKSLSILEIFPPPTAGYLPYHYLMLSRMYNFNYQGIVGGKSIKKFSGGFYLDSQLLKVKIKKLLET